MGIPCLIHVIGACTQTSLGLCTTNPIIWTDLSEEIMRVMRQYGDGVCMGIIRGNQRAEQTTFKFRGSEKRNFLCEAGDFQNAENQRGTRK